MAITDATGSLALTWTEQDPVTFTAGTLASSTEMLAEVQAKVQRGTLSTTTTPSTTQVNQWLIRGKEMLCQRFGFTWARRYASATLTAASYRFALPPDYDGGPLRMRDTTNDEWMSPIDSLVFDSNFPDVSGRDSGEPGENECTIKDRELWLSRPANASTTLELEYHRSADDNTAADMSFIPEPFRWKIVDYAVGEAFELLHQFEQAGYYRQKWEAEMGVARRADGRKRWAAGGYRAQPWFV